MKNIATIILAGGEGKRLMPLTATRCKPSIPFGGQFCLIDIPIYHSIASGCHKIFVISQYLASSLRHHIFDTYAQSEDIEVLTPCEGHYFEGTADAVRKNLNILLKTPADYFLILAGDQLYNLDFSSMLKIAKQTGADLVMGAIPVARKDTSRLGILKVDDDSQIIDFAEKPQEEALLNTLKTLNLDMQREFLGSMGIYLFKRDALLDLLRLDSREDFGKHLIPTQIKKGKTVAYLYDGYWEDIGTIGTFYQANLALTEATPHFNFYRKHFALPKITKKNLEKTILSEETMVQNVKIFHSIVGGHAHILEGTDISHSYLIGGGGKSSEFTLIGKDCLIKKAIIDHNVHIGDNVQLINSRNLQEHQNDYLHVKEGIIVVPSGTRIPDGFKF